MRFISQKSSKTIIHLMSMTSLDKKILIMKKVIPLVLGSFLFLGATACGQNPDTATTDGGVRSDQIESDARAREQRDGTTSAADNEQQTTTTDDGVRSDQIESDARARDQRDGANPGTEGEQQTTGDLAVEVRNSLESQLPGSRLAVDVDGDNGMATINGTVLSQAQFDQIKPLAMTFEGIKSVDVKAEIDSE
jgi:hyperosmotically inducible protein